MYMYVYDIQLSAYQLVIFTHFPSSSPTCTCRPSLRKKSKSRVKSRPYPDSRPNSNAVPSPDSNLDSNPDSNPDLGLESNPDSGPDSNLD